jgi:hypothetical protein
MRGKIYPKMISQKAKESENKRQNHPKKSPAIRHRSSPKRKRKRLLEVQNSQKSEIRVKKMEDDHTFEENIILQQLSRGRGEGFLRAKNCQKSEMRVKKMEGMICRSSPKSI